jgi:hypothetical protein
MDEAAIIEAMRTELSRQQAALTRDPPYVSHADPARTIMSGTFDLESLARALALAFVDAQRQAAARAAA